MAAKLEDCYCCHIDPNTGVSCQLKPEWYVEAEADGHLGTHSCDVHLPELMSDGWNQVVALKAVV